MTVRACATPRSSTTNSRPGKISVTPTKQLTNQRDLALAYSPGVAAACEEIVADPATRATTPRAATWSAVVTNGTAVLGLGNIGPLAAKPVMEGKAVLFKKFAGIDVFDIEIDERDPDKLVDIIAALEPTFGGINLEDIKAPECFYIERKLRERMKIPVFHDDQHGTAIIVGAAVLNGLKVVGKDIDEVKLVVSGAGAAALACLDLLVRLGLPSREHLASPTSRASSTRAARRRWTPDKARYAQETDARTLAEVIARRRRLPRPVGRRRAQAGDGGEDGDAAADPRARQSRARDPARASRRRCAPDAVIATGRSDYPNQVNNVLCFPFIFRGALDVGATTINERDEARRGAARSPSSRRPEQSRHRGAAPTASEDLTFGPEYLIPQAVRSAPDRADRAGGGEGGDGLAASRRGRSPTSTPTASGCTQFVYHSGLIMKPVFAAAQGRRPKRIVYAEGEDERVLRAVQVVVDEGSRGRSWSAGPTVIEQRIERLGLRMQAGHGLRARQPGERPALPRLLDEYHRLTRAQGRVAGSTRRLEMRRAHTLIGAMLMHTGEADGMLCGTFGALRTHLHYIDQRDRPAPGRAAAMRR